MVVRTPGKPRIHLEFEISNLENLELGWKKLKNHLKFAIFRWIFIMTKVALLESPPGILRFLSGVRPENFSSFTWKTWDLVLKSSDYPTKLPKQWIWIFAIVIKIFLDNFQNLFRGNTSSRGLSRDKWGGRLWINPSYYKFLGKIIFDLHINIDRVHPVQILSCSGYCITTHIMLKNTKNAEKTPKSQK